MRRRSETPERDEIQVRSREHHLNPDQDENRVPPTEGGKQADGKQRRGNDDEELKCWCHGSPGRKRPTPNVQHSMSNSESLLNSALSVERLALGVCFIFFIVFPP
jgi:hypothetical protein